MMDSLTDHHTALCFWCDAYRSGVRITHNGTHFIYHTVDWLRIHHTKRFGLIEIAPCVPPAELIADVEASAEQLKALLSQTIPAGLDYWFFHPLSLDYEARPLVAMAAKIGVSVYLEPCRMGVWPVVLPGVKPEVSTSSLPPISPILANHGYTYHYEAYKL
jgi:hypothetical protein